MAAGSTQEWELAAHLHGAAAALRTSLQAAPSEEERVRIVTARAHLLGVLGEERFVAESAEGEAMPLEEAIALALDTEMDQAQP